MNTHRRHLDPYALLDRDSFRTATLALFDGRCALCPLAATDAHHVFERKLFSDGGYRLANACPLCPRCHLLAETGDASLSRVLDASARRFGWTPLLPDHVLALGWNASRADLLDKWGNMIRPDGSRAPGPLADDDGCRKALLLGQTRFPCYDAGDFPWRDAMTNFPSEQP